MDIVEVEKRRTEMMVQTWAASGHYDVDIAAERLVHLCVQGDLPTLKSATSCLDERELRKLVHYAGNRPLKTAVQHKHLDCVAYLIEFCGADIHAWTDRHDNVRMIAAKDAPITLAVCNNDSPMLDYLLTRHSEPLCTDHESDNTTSDLRMAVERGFIDAVRRLWRHGEREKLLFGIFYGTPSESIIPLLELCAELGYAPSLQEWNHVLVSAVGRNVTLLSFVWENCPMQAELDLAEAMSQACYCQHDYGPLPLFDYLLDVCHCPLDLNTLANGFWTTTRENGKVRDRTPFLRWIEHKGIPLRGNAMLLEKAQQAKREEIVTWLKT